MSRFKIKGRARPCHWCWIVTAWETAFGLAICDDCWEAGRG